VGNTSGWQVIVRLFIIVAISIGSFLCAVAITAAGMIRSKYAPNGCSIHSFEIIGPDSGNLVTLSRGNEYGWTAVIYHTRPVSWEESLILPVAPKTWGNSLPFNTTDGGRTTRTVSDILTDLSEVEPWWIRLSGVRTSFASHGWSVAEGDPPGPYEFIVNIDGDVQKKFTLLFAEPPAEPK
jgi:hypothetical protein